MIHTMIRTIDIPIELIIGGGLTEALHIKWDVNLGWHFYGDLIYGKLEHVQINDLGKSLLGEQGSIPAFLRQMADEIEALYESSNQD